MNPSLQKLNVFLGKLQTDQSAAIGGLTGAADFCAVNEMFEVNYNQQFSEQNLAQGILGQPQSVKGVAECDVKVTMPVIPTASDTEPNVHDFLLCSGFMQTQTAQPPFTYKYQTDNEDAVGKRMEVWTYTGDKNSTNALLTKVRSVAYDVAIKGKLGEPCFFEFTGKGCPVAAPGTAAFLTDSPAALADVVPSVIKATTMTLCGITSKILEFEVTMGGAVVLKKDPAEDFGYDKATISDRKSKLKAKIYQENISSGNVFTKMTDQTAGNFVMAWGDGTSDNNLSLSSSSCAIGKVAQSSEDDLNTFDVEAEFVNNNWQLDINV